MNALVPGGGAGPQLTADLIARAIIAAALAYGDDPVKACTSHKTATCRRTLGAAVGGIDRATDLGLARVGEVLGVRPTTVYTARSQRKPGFVAAEVAAMRAVEFALWQPSDVEDDGDDGAAEDVDEARTPALFDEAWPPALPEPEPVPVAAPAPVMVPILVAAIPEGLKRPAPGPIASRMQPTQTMRHLTAAEGERAIRDLVLEALAGGPKDSMNLASCVDRKEMAVIVELNALQRDGSVMSEPIEDGARRFRWHLTEKGRGA